MFSSIPLDLAVRGRELDITPKVSSSGVGIAPAVSLLRHNLYRSARSGGGIGKRYCPLRPLAGEHACCGLRPRGGLGPLAGSNPAPTGLVFS